MSEDSTPQEETSTPKKGLGRVAGILVFLVVVVLMGFLVKIQWEKYQLRQETKAYLKEAQTFIDKRRFIRAEESLALARELMPNRSEIDSVQEELDQARVINFYEKEITESLQSRDWDKVQKAIVALRKRDPGHPKIKSAQKQMELGRHKAKLDALLAELTQAQRDNDLGAVVKIAGKLLIHDPESALSERWKEIKENASEEIRLSEQKARGYYQQAQAIDQGVYSQDMVSLARKAKALSDKPEYQEFFERVSKYPRIIYYPNEFSNLQDAIAQAREIDTIQISQGSFHAPIIIDKKVRLVGEKGKSIVLHSSGKNSPVVYVTKDGELEAENVMFKHVEIAEGISVYSAVVVEGRASMKSCAVFESAGHGIHVLNGGSLYLETSRLESNRWSGLAASGKSTRVVVKRSVAAKNRQNGIDLWDHAELKFQDSFSEENLQSGVVVVNKAQVEISGSTSRGNFHTGLYVAEGGKANLLRCELSKNVLAGAFGDQSGKVYITSCNVLDNYEAGMVLTKGTTWQGLDRVSFVGNEGEKIWKDAEFRMTDLLKRLGINPQEISVQNKTSPPMKAIVIEEEE